MVTGLDQELEEVRVLNKDLQADMENCRRRESELLYLTEKLSNKNAPLQSENTSLNNQVCPCDPLSPRHEGLVFEQAGPSGCRLLSV